MACCAEVVDDLCDVSLVEGCDTFQLNYDRVEANEICDVWVAELFAFVENRQADLALKWN